MTMHARTELNDLNERWLLQYVTASYSVQSSRELAEYDFRPVSRTRTQRISVARSFAQARVQLMEPGALCRSSARSSFV